MKINKKGELSSNQLITIIILIISFAIIVAFFVMLGLKSTIDKETCRNSVITRGALPFGKDAVQLKCKTQDVCLTMGDDCMVNRKDIITIKVNNEEELTKEMVNLIYDCWWMMGEGKVNYMSGWIGFSEAYCSICSKVIFDKKIQEKYPSGISYKNIYDYMQTTKIPERDESYLFNMYKINSLEIIRQKFLGDGGWDIYDYKIDPNKEYVVTMAIVEDGWAEEIIAGITTLVAVGSVALAPFTFGTSLALGAAAGAVATGITMAVPGKDVSYLYPIYLEFNGKELAALNCKEYVSEG